jgi:hypothetical protein
LSTQQILGVVGGVVGAFFGYPQLGFVVGSLVGGLLTPGEKTEGPRVDDLKVQVSTYGAGIPILRGTERAGGNVVWSTDKIETSTTETQGKGGAPEHTSYRYFVHMGIVLCETPRDGSIVSIVQIFQDGKLIWDGRTGIPVSAALASAENPYAFFVLYQGHADQLPDPIEELEEGGPGSVPAYRGVVRIRMNGVECPGGRVPQFSFVLSTSAAPTTEVLPFCEVPIVASGTAAWAVVRSNEVWHFSASGSDFAGNLQYPIYYGSDGEYEKVGVASYPTPHYGNSPVPVSGDGTPCALRFRTNSAADMSLPASIDRIDLTTGQWESIYTYIPSSTEGELISIPNSSAGYDSTTGKYVIRGGDGLFGTNLCILNGPTFTIGEMIPGVAGPVTIKNGVGYAVSKFSGFLRLTSFETDTGTITDGVSGPLYADSTSSLSFAALHPGEDGLYVWIRDGETLGNIVYSVYYIDYSLTAWVLLSTGIEPKLGFFPTTIHATKQLVILGPASQSGGMHAYNVFRLQPVTTSPVRVKDIISEQCERAEESRFDVSGIPDTDTLIGYKLQNPASARSNIDPLLTAFAIYIVDEDGVIKFKKYEDIVPEATIAYDELGQAEDGSEPADAMPLNRAQEIDMPRSVSVSYIEPTFDYQTASEKEVRQITEATEDMIVELPMATTSNHAKKVASMIMFARWRGQNTRSFKTSRKYAFLSPGDGVTVEYPRGTFRLWRITSMTDTGVLCEFNVEPGDAELYTQTAIGAAGYVGQEVSALAPATRMLLLDSPIMRDVDNNAGLYVAAEGLGSGWRGYTLWIGDDDTNLQDRGTVTTTVPIGVAETALGAWTPNGFDGRSHVTINMGADSLSSTTVDLMYTSRVNLALIGTHGRWEAIQFQVASDLGGGRFLIYGFLRGLFGTERFAGTHVFSDQFVLITPAGMLRPTQDVGSLGQTKSYRPVSLGRSLQSTQSQRFANTGVGLLPYSPWNASKSKAASNDQTITWERRTRMTSNALRGVVPLGEVVESYSVEFYTSSAFTTLAGTLTSSTKSLTITSAQQTAFGLTPGATLYVHISQVSDSVGAGAPLEATL